MRVAITGASGLIGGALAAALRAAGDDVIGIGRGARADIRWNPAAGTIEADKLDGIDAIVNLAGERIAQRWTAGRKQRILDSRVQGTALLVATMASMRRPPSALISGSAIGHYGDRGDAVLDERSAPGNDFLASVTQAWEAAALAAASSATRVVLLRTGIVLARNGGALPKMLLPFHFGVGGPVGSGRQWMSWISLTDQVRAMMHLLREPLRGPFNLVAPTPVENADFARAAGRVLRRPAFMRVPRFAIELALGEMGTSTLLASQRAAPTALIAGGFSFSHATVDAALRHELAVSSR